MAFLSCETQIEKSFCNGKNSPVRFSFSSIQRINNAYVLGGIGSKLLMRMGYEEVLKMKEK